MSNSGTAKPDLVGDLPYVGTTIYTVMSKLVAECGAINLSQGRTFEACG